MKPYISSPSPIAFWITNISKKAISLADLGITIYPMRSVNLFDTNHYRHITRDQILTSAASGSLLAKSKYVVVRKVAPNTPMQTKILLQEDAIFQGKHRSVVEIERKTYDELIMKDEDFAEENAELASEDHLGKYAK